MLKVPRLSLIALIFGSFVSAWGQKPEKVQFRNTLPGVDFTGSKSCEASGCHDEISRSYAQTWHGNSMGLGACRREVRSEVQGIRFIGKHGEIVGEWLGEPSSASDILTTLLWSAKGNRGLGTVKCSKAAFSNPTGRASIDCAWHKSVATRCAHFLTRGSGTGEILAPL